MKYKANVRMDVLNSLTVDASKLADVIESTSAGNAVLHAYDSNGVLHDRILVKEDDLILESVDRDIVVMNRNEFDVRYEVLPTRDKFVFEKYEDKNGEYRHRLLSANGQVVMIPGEGYKNEGTMEDVIFSLIEAVRDNRINITEA